MEHEEPYLCGYLGEVHPTLENVVRLTMLPLFLEANAIGIILEGEDQTKLKCLTVAWLLLDF